MPCSQNPQLQTVKKRSFRLSWGSSSLIQLLNWQIRLFLNQGRLIIMRWQRALGA
nr:MAG TPA: hypothetical protein [Caudoviricetes sp.]